jgi:trk system potassium uptake protein TrkA
MRIIIVGGGEVGFALSRELSHDHAISVVDNEPEVRERFENLDVEFLSGSGTSAETLQRARVKEADLFIACTGLDEVNMVSCAIAKGLGTARTICFVSRDDFAGRSGSADSIREHFGIERLIWPEAQLA